MTAGGLVAWRSPLLVRAILDRFNRDDIPVDEVLDVWADEWADQLVIRLRGYRKVRFPLKPAAAIRAIVSERVIEQAA
jgi:hypothetical protein